MVDLYLMRHGQTRFNLQKRVQGACDSPLTDKGIEEAKLAGQYFRDRGIHFTSLYSSTQERACDTVELVTGSADYQRVKGLKEWDFGWFEGERELLMPQLKGDSFGDYFLPYGGESSQQVGERMTASLQQLLEQHEAGDSVLAVSHGGAMWCFLLSLSLENLPKLAFPNCCICHYRYEAGQFDLIEVIDPISQDLMYQKEGVNP